jgi:membrane fusion protein (multidrug efflux system)
MKRFITVAVIVLLVVLVCGGIFWFNSFRDKMIGQFFAHFPVPTVTVSTVDVKPQVWNPGIDAVGTASAAEGVDLAAQVGGIVKSVNFKANDKVQAGALLVQIDDTVDRSGLAAAESTVAVSSDALTRIKALVDRNVGTVADMQTAQNKLDQARGALDQLKATIALKAIAAPFSGTIGIPKVEAGQYIQGGTVIATLQNLDAMKVNFTVPEQQMASLSVGQDVAVGLSDSSLGFSGKVTGIDPKIDPTSRLVSVEARVEQTNGALQPGQFVHIRVKLPTEPNVIALPQTAVTISLYGNYVYQVVPAPPPAPDTAGAPAAPATQAAGATDKPAEPELVVKQIFVQTGRRSGDQIEILKGVEPGMKIVTSGQNKLSNGSKVAIDNSISLSSEQTSVQ